MVDHAILPPSSMNRAGVPRTRPHARARFSRIAIARVADSRDGPAGRLHMHGCSNVEAEQRPAHGDRCRSYVNGLSLFAGIEMCVWLSGAGHEIGALPVI